MYGVMDLLLTIHAEVGKTCTDVQVVEGSHSSRSHWIDKFEIEFFLLQLDPPSDMGALLERFWSLPWTSYQYLATLETSVDKLAQQCIEVLT